jgi:hypothetical protein
MMRIDVTLTIKENLQGQGNTSCGHYDYEFVPDVVHVCKQPAEIVYSLAGEDCDRFAIAHMYTTDIKNQLSKPQRNHDDTSISVFHSNTDRQLINGVSVFGPGAAKGEDPRNTWVRCVRVRSAPDVACARVCLTGPDDGLTRLKGLGLVKPGLLLPNRDRGDVSPERSRR